MRVVLAAEAEADLEQIADYIATDNPIRAATFLDEIRHCVEELAATPLAFPLVPRYESLGVRRRIFQSYLIFFCINTDRIDVLHIVHGRRNLDALLSSAKP